MRKIRKENYWELAVFLNPFARPSGSYCVLWAL
jgi:hypothetical protein